MRRSYAFKTFKCQSCHLTLKKLIETHPNDTSTLACECGSEMHSEYRPNQTRFQPFWSDTMQCRINDREDLAKLKKYAKDNGLVNVGHTQMKPDRAAIRWNYEHD